jgi:23S rRNA pseudouridine1911/1915/1917 synthase
VGHPIVSDPLYGGAELSGLPRLGLHAYSLRLFHPGSKDEMEFIAPYVEDMVKAIDSLRLVTANENQTTPKLP